MASLPKRPTKKHVEYTSFETDAIIKGIKILGDNPGRWADIKRMFPVELAPSNQGPLVCCQEKVGIK
jgi:hypothetical protein